MSKYIDREDLLNNLKRFAPEHLTPLIVMLIEKQPTADVVEVVRCKDCTEWDKDEYECSHWYGFREDDYCSYGERMDGETNNGLAWLGRPLK